jgi:hypothetical protein
VGQMTNAAIAVWQKQAGIEEATPDMAKLLNELSRAAYELIKVIELERSGIRDGDGCWHGSDGLGGAVNDMVRLCAHLERSRLGTLQSRNLADYL